MADRFRRLSAALGPTILMPILAVLSLCLPAAGQPAGFGSAGFGNDPMVEVSAKPAAAEVAPGGQLVVAVIMDHGDELHSWPSAAEDVLTPEIAEFAIRTAIEAEPADWVDAFGAVQWPEPKPAMVPNVTGEGPASVEALTYKGRAVAYLPVLIAPDAPLGPATLSLSVRLQACDDILCHPPQYEELTVEVAIAATPTAPEPDDDFAAFEPSVFADLAEGQAPFATGPEGGLWSWLPSGLVGLALGGLLGGLVLNLTPCVLPVIPIKIMTLTSHAGESRRRTVLLGLFMSAGVVFFWAALAFPMLLLESFTDPSRLFGYWWFTAGIGVVIVAMSLGLFGLFELTLPQWVYRINPKADSPQGSFLFGVMTAVLGLPCFGFVVGGLLPATASADAAVILTIFVSLGVGMAVPYFLLSLFPSLVSRVPKTGPASSLVKQVLGLLLVAAGMFFIGSGVLAYLRSDPAFLASSPWWSKTAHWWLVGLFVAAAGVWLVWQTFRLTKRRTARAGFGVLGTLFVLAGAAVGYDRTMHAYHDFWVPYTEATVADALDQGRVVVLDFTAEWCANCKALEATVLRSPRVKEQLLSDSVVPIMADLTANSAPGWTKLRELGQTGIPTLAVFGPGFQDGPWISNAYTSGQVLDAIERARGSGPAEIARGG